MAINREPTILLMRGNSITFGGSNDSDWKIVNQEGILKFISGSINYETSSRLMIDDTSGNISIGYNSYTNELYNYKININGDINLTGDLYKNGNLLISSLNASNIDSGTLSVGYGGTGLTYLSPGLLLIGDGINAMMQSSNLVWDNTNNRLGIGTINPTSTLDVNGIIQSSGILCSDGPLMIDSNNNVNIGYGNLFFDALYNNIGIGTTQPNTKLHVLGDTRIEGNLIVNGTTTVVNTDISTSEQIIITNDGTGPALIINQTGAQPIIEIQDDEEICFKIFDGGHVGIGTSTKDVNVDISGNLNLSGIITGIGSGLTSLNASHIDSGTLSVSCGGIGTTSLLTSSVLIGNGTNELIQPTNLIWDTVSSFLGVGKTNPETTLDVNGIIQSSGILCSDGPLMIDSNNNVNIGYGNIFFDALYNNIGIGTTQPNTKLHVFGDTCIEGNLIVNGTSTVVNTDISNSEQMIITNDGTGPALIVNQTGNQPIIEIQDDGDTCLKIFDEGHVGIGTSTKYVNVDISGNLKLSGIITGSGSELYLLNASNISSGTLSISRGGIGTTTLLSNSVLVGNGINALLQPTNLVWNNTNTRLGVGKTNPMTTLDVNGIITGIGSGLTTLNATNISSGTLPVARGGIGTTTLTSGQLLIGNGTSALLQSTNLSWNNTSKTLSATNFIGSGVGLSSLNATNISSGTLPVAHGGIGTTTLTSGQLLIGNATGALLQSTNLSWNNTSKTLSATNFIGSGAGLTSLNATNISSGTLPVARGGIGATTLTSGQLLIGNATGALIQSANLSWNNTSTRLGIGVTIPQRTAHIQSSIRIGGASATLDFGDDLNNQIYKNNTNNDIIIKTNGTDKLIINSLGNVGIGITTPALKLHVVGDIAATGTVTANYSDERLKTIVSKINNPLKIINNLNGFYYIPNKLANTYGINSTNTEIGLNAQEIQKELPEIVKLAPFDIELKDGEIISKSGQNYLTVSYERLIPVIIEAIKELTKEINDIKKIISN